MIERTAQCLLGNGDCQQDCGLYDNAVEITSKMGDDFDPEQSRRTIMFWDAHHHDVNVVGVAAVIAKCAKEHPQDERNSLPQ